MKNVNHFNLIIKNDKIENMMMSNPKTILIVEDEQSLSDILASKLSACGFSILKAENGERGLDLALKHHPDLILLDIIMPKMDGMTMVHRLREYVWGSTARIIILTNLMDNEKVVEAMKNKVSDYLIKTDWKLKNLVDIIKKKLG